MLFQELCQMRPFILLELLIALALVSSALVPIVQAPIRHASSEFDALFKMELSRLAEEAFIEMKIALLDGKVPAAYLEDFKFHEYARMPVSIHLPGGISRTYQRVLSVRCDRKKKTPEGKTTDFVFVRVKYEQPRKRKAVLQAYTHFTLPDTH